jgi:diguanylate cyclase (GGDEF)-like protein
MVARLGGDEFAVWLNNADLAIAERRARGFRDQMAALASYSGSPERPLGMSIGIAVWVPGQESVAQLLARADAAMYEAKRMGKGGYAVAPPPG